MPTRPTSPAADVDARQLLQNLLAQGYTKAETARRLGRSRRTLDFILAGQKPGTNLRQSLHELNQSGQVSTPPTRRLARDGAIARVRGPRGQPAVTPPPPPPPAQDAPAPAPPAPAPATSAPAPTPGRASRRRQASRSTDQPEFTQLPLAPGPNTLNHEQHTLGPNGEREFHRIQVPKAHLAWNRELGREIVTDIVDRARRQAKRMQFTVWVEVGTGARKQRRAVQLGGKGGYDAQDVYSGIVTESNDPFGWLAGQVAGRYPEFEQENWTVVSVDLDIW